MKNHKGGGAMTTIKYKHYRHRFGKLFMTICFQFPGGATEFMAAGVAICSDRDQFSRKIGRDISLSRLKKALLSRRNTLPIKHRNSPVICEAIAVLGFLPAFKSVWGGE